MQHQTPIPKSGDVIKAAINAAGGHTVVAAAFGVSQATVHGWIFRESVPAQYVRRLSELGGGIVTVDALLAAIERTKERAAA